MIDMSSWDIGDEKVIEAIRGLDRRTFVPNSEKAFADEDKPLPIGCGQTISQPYIVAYMTEKLEVCPENKILEIGTGSGYQTAILACLASRVYSVERIPELANKALKLLGDMGYANISLRLGNGRLGWPDKAPFDRIIIAAAARRPPQKLFEQLAPGGRMIYPLGPNGGTQFLVLVTKTNRGIIESRKLLPVRFVPLI